jgi:transcriptional antiterminator NusG
MNMTDEAWFVVRNTPNVTGFVGSHGNRSKPTPLFEEEIQEILQGMGKVVREITFDIHVGKRVKIIDGAFSGFEGPITEVNGDKVKVTVDMFGRETPVELDLQQIDEISY